MSAYLIVFHGDYQLFQTQQRIKDISDDPCFDDLPTWGICRPPTRKGLKIGDKVIFIAFYREIGSYYFKGWFEVGEKISYNEALIRFPNRQNVIISNMVRRSNNQIWRYRKLKVQYTNQYGNVIPTWLERVVVHEGTFYQNNIDYHEIDNWKCRRIFHCNSNQFIKCISNNACEKDSTSLTQFKNYIVSHPNNWRDLEKHLIQYNAFTNITGINIALATPMRQHNVLSIDNYIETFLTFFDKY